MSRADLTIPAGSEVRLGFIRPVSWLTIVPPGARARGPDAVNVFPHPAGLNWPNAEARRRATVLLAAGFVVALEFHRFADAMAAHKRITRETAA